MALEHLFQGSALNAVDAKGRVSVPAFLRSVIERRGDARTIVLAKNDSFGCLSAYDPAYAALKHETDPSAELDYARRTMMAFGATEEVPYDSSGRIILPPMMRRKGQLDELALFIGVGETFQIWNPKLFLADPNVPEDMKDIARFRLEERGQ